MPDETRSLEQVPEGAPRAGRPVEQVRCSSCGKTMAPDQRYCLECGYRRGGSRVEFNDYLGDRSEAEKPGLPAVAPPPPPPTVPPAYAVPGGMYDPRPVREVTPLMAAAGLMAFCLILIFGVLIGKQGNAGGTPAPIMATTGMPTPTTSTGTDVNVSFQADWPADKEGFTIELATLTKEGTDPSVIESTKVELSGKGASEVGVLDSDEFGSLPEGNYVFYSGEYSSKGEAKKELASLQASFPDAQVIEVAAEASSMANGDGGGGDDSLIQEDGEGQGTAPVEASKEALEDLNSGTAEEYQDALKKLPPTIETEGKAPPKDNKAPGGGSGTGVEIG